MTSRANWQIVRRSIDAEPESPLFFTEHEWATIEAATARIYPTDQAPGAREAKAARFIDRYLSGLDYIFASADGSGFLRIGGKDADAWGTRIERLQHKYREGIRQMDEIATQAFSVQFRHLDDSRQDRVLEILSGAPKPTGVRVAEAGEAHVQNISDDALDFFSALALHTRQGTFCDPVYGGNAGRAGWEAIGFPGPQSLAATQDCTYGHKDKFLADFEWADLIPHLRNKAG
ncbi:gluconate 2-dehydrogenase subunit 3 family protein [Rhizobium rosettiformans]|uniref:gluconate 2-dehydrogenase subunit 3 family protein n=1 Tax=Rhizobium rosettiformans TaxID=1368430 RepID=UPI00285FEB35|nr:gluconate 2-dehydrogenase subunit 3 family protein [Rhizobium rosettiformans]MDR7031166.1 gluconate 2-dehydrogenase gamma chain [Rhizobium rosettiformans]MDR7066731.1 gluconate 2-dehydrogenase gamma chain [Rhizobium rosettiformans]